MEPSIKKFKLTYALTHLHHHYRHRHHAKQMNKIEHITWHCISRQDYSIHLNDIFFKHFSIIYEQSLKDEIAQKIENQKTLL